MDAIVLQQLRNTNLLPKNYEDFKTFVKHLVNFPVHDGAVESVWKIIYSQDADNAVSITGNREENYSNERALERSYRNVNNQFCILDEQIERKSNQESTVTSSSDIEILDPVIESDKVEEQKSDGSDIVEILDEHCTTAHRCSSENRSNGIGSEQLDVTCDSFVSSGSNEDDIVMLAEIHKKESDPKLKKKKKKHAKLKRLKTEVQDLKKLLLNLLESPNKKNCVENALGVLNSNTKGRLNDRELKKQESRLFKNVSNNSPIEEKERRTNQDGIHCSSPGTSSSSSRRIRDKFPWHDSIVDTINSAPQKRISVTRLKNKVITRYMLHRGNISENTLHKFLKYLHTAPGVIIQNGYASISLE